MPVAVIGAIAAAGSVAAAGGIAAVGAGIMAGGLGALAAGAMVVGSALTIAGKLTGNKTLGKIGMGFTLAGGIGSFAAAARGAAGAAGATAGAEGSAAARAADLSTNEGLIASKMPGAKNVIADNAFKTFNAAGSDGINSVSSAIESGAGIGADVGNLATEPNLFDRLNASLTKYNGAMNIAGGIGDAVIGNQRISAEVNQANKDRDFKREVSDRNYAGTAGSMPGRNVRLNQASQGLLGGSTSIPNTIPGRSF